MRRGCENRRGLRIDHIVEYCKGGILDERNAWRICEPCDHLKQHCGWVVVGQPGSWDLVPPDDPRARTMRTRASGPDPP